MPLQARQFLRLVRRHGPTAWCAAALAAGAGALLYQWLPVWLAAPDSGSGWLAAAVLPYLLFLRWQDRPAPRSAPLPALVWPALVLGFGLIPSARLFLEPFPGWPLAEWIYAAAILGISLVLIAAWGGAAMTRHLAFPVCFALAALPWPAVLESGAIEPLRVLLARIVAELCILGGEPAVARGTVIQLGNATLGIEEACGGIRSLQVAVIVALAAGELRRDRWPGRLGWMAAAILLSLAGNGLRLCALAWIAAQYGTGVLAIWHDRLGWLELGFLFGGLGALFALAGPRRMQPGAQPARPVRATVPTAALVIASIFIAVLFVAEVSTRRWFSAASAAGARPVQWSAQLPRNAPGYAGDAFTPSMQALLGCDAHQLGHWTDSLGARRAGYVIEWHRGQNARFAILHHNPDICLPYSGSRFVRSRHPVIVRRGAVKLRFACREFSDDRGVFYVYYLAWDLTTGRPFGRAGEIPGTGESWLRLQWREVAARRRSIAARVVAIAIFDASGGSQADQAFRAEAAAIIRPAPSAGR